MISNLIKQWVEELNVLFFPLKKTFEDGGGIGWEDHFLLNKFIERTFER